MSLQRKQSIKFERNEKMKALKEMKFIKGMKKPTKKTIKRGITMLSGVAVLAIAGIFAMEHLEVKAEQKEEEAKYQIASSQAAEAGISIITSDEAKEIALNAASLKEEQVKYLEVDFDMETPDVYDDHDEDCDDRKNNTNTNNTGEQTQASTSPQYVYEVEFSYNGLEYDFEIDGVTKQVLQFEVDSDR